MSTAQTKIELVTEAIEALVLATVVTVTGSQKNLKINHQNVVDARAAVADALKELLTPTLRVVCTERTDTVGAISTKLPRTGASIAPAA